MFETGFIPLHLACLPLSGSFPSFGSVVECREWENVSVPLPSPLLQWFQMSCTERTAEREIFLFGSLAPSSSQSMSLSQLSPSLFSHT